MSCANTDSFTSSFPIWIPLIAFSCLTALARASNIMLSKSGKCGHPYLAPDLTGKAFRVSSLSMMLAMGLSYWPYLHTLHLSCSRAPVFLRAELLHVSSSPVFAADDQRHP